MSNALIVLEIRNYLVNSRNDDLEKIMVQYNLSDKEEEVVFHYAEKVYSLVSDMNLLSSDERLEKEDYVTAYPIVKEYVGLTGALVGGLVGSILFNHPLPSILLGVVGGLGCSYLESTYKPMSRLLMKNPESQMRECFEEYINKETKKALNYFLD